MLYTVILVNKRCEMNNYAEKFYFFDLLTYLLCNTELFYLNCIFLTKII